MSGALLINDDEKNAVIDVFEKQNGVLFAHGADDRRNHIFQTKLFESEFAQYLNVPHVALVSSGTAALKCALSSLSLDTSKKIVVQPYNFIALAEVLYDSNIDMIWAKMDANLSICPKWLSEFLSLHYENISAICVTSMLGSVPDLIELKRICDSYNLPLILDSCESLGATLDGKDLSFYATVACYSFDFGKTITSGEGGAVVSCSESIVKYVKSFRDHGHAFLDDVPRNLDVAFFPGFNYRITELQAAILRVQLKKLPLIVSLYEERFQAFYNSCESNYLKSCLRADVSNSVSLKDNIFLIFNDSRSVSDGLDFLSSGGFSIKNVPNALHWHDAFYWDHICPGISSNTNVINSHSVLSNSIAINIDITKPVHYYTQLGLDLSRVY